ncbi:MAG: hypothetical protein KKA73_29535 [Chloroflexi bacterium]|nr:hypothetical protein [Chloroflexota bacterium]MBU1751840.1 hypothetical protein [Chloroflexota bacterium]
MKRWQAIDGRGHPIVSVGAADEAEAREKVRYQLDRPGRRDFLKRWVAGGEQVRLVEDQEQQP